MKKYTLQSAALLGTASCMLSCGTDNSEKSTRPNIVIIYADDMGYGDMSCQNPDSKIQTPHLDRLAAEGMRFTDGHSSAGVSSPSRYALLTGNYHWRRMRGIVNDYEGTAFKPNEFTLPRMLGEMGYKTAMVGKWHLGWNWDAIIKPEYADWLCCRDSLVKYARPEHFDWSKPFTGGPTEIGFDTYFGDGTINFPPYCWIENDKAVTAPTFMVKDLNYNPLEGHAEIRQGPAAADWHPTKVLPAITKRTLDIIKQQKSDAPFFIYCALSAPHAPIHPNDEFIGKSQAGAYGDFVVQCDDIVGQITQALKEKGLSDNTVVIFSADNGPERYAYPRIENFEHNSTESLRGLKRDLWEGGHRVPFIVKWDGKIKANSVNTNLTSQIDILATIADITGYTVPADVAVDSRSMLGSWLGEKLEQPIRETLVHHTFKDIFALRQGDYVLVNNYTGAHSKMPNSYNEEYDYELFDEKERSALLYNLKDDLAERHDLSEREPERVAEMKSLLMNLVNSTSTK